ncbi:MAG TPA: carboxypeptidase regulatory-like domain-containing protein, partial [Bryobacteraceae bacterium]|nr:carboxypeptidase regulatory-like domain-containing protein [Bryobacteraceae bacterium]
MRQPAFRLASAAFCIGAFLFEAPPIKGQAVANAQVTGEVTDPTGAAVAGATVTMTETERGVSHQTKSDSNGRYTLPNLPVGPYRLEASLAGFKTYTQTGITLQVGDHPVINIGLQVGAVTENVEVTAGAAMVQSEQTSISQVINQKSIVELPLNGRQPTQLVLISGASVVTGGGDMTGSKNYWTSTTISVGGGQGNGTNYLLDGGDNVDTMTNVNLPFPFPDALQEFSVDTNALPARNGTQPGGVVNIVTKSGTNQFHGSAFEFLRNGDVNARNYFGKTHDLLKRNQFGGTLGGRIIRDKLFFFGGYQGTRIRNVSPSSTAYVPTAAELAGDFSVAESPACIAGATKPRKITIPGTKTAIGDTSNVFASGVKFDPAALALVKFLPTTSDPCGKLTYSTPSIQNEDQGIGRLDWIQSSKHTAFLRYFYTTYLQPAFYDPTNVLVTTSPGNDESAQSATIGDTYTFNPTTVNSLHATFTRRTDFRGPNSNFFNAKKLGINITTLVPDDFRLSVSNPGFSVGCGTCSPGYFNVTTYQLADDVDLIRGRHHLGFGVDIIYTQNNLLSGYLQNGSFAFDGVATGDSMLDFLTGTMSGFSQSLPQQPAPRMTIPALYVQDTIHATSRLTVNAGLRWEPMFWPVDHWHRGSAFSMANFLAGVHSKVYSNAPAGSLYYGDPGVNASFTGDNKLSVFSPRLGLAWDPKGDGKQTLRVGAALMYDSGMLYTAQRLASNPPFVNEIDLQTSNPGGFSDPWNTGYHYPGGNPFPPTGSYFPQYALYVVLPQDFKPMSVAQWNVSYQRQFGSSWLASISYLGNKTSHVWLGQETNPAVYSPSVCAQFSKGCTTSNTNQRRVLGLLDPTQGQYYGGLDYVYDGGNANYNALLVSAQQRLSHGVTFLANYTWSHCISDGDFTRDIAGPTFLNPYDLRMDRG